MDAKKRKIIKTKLQKKDRAKNRVQELIGKSAGTDQLTEEIVQIVETAVDLICDERIKKLTIEARAGIKISANITAKGKIKISKELKNSKEFEE